MAISMAYQSTPALSGWFRGKAAVVAADIALNLGISATQTKGILDNAVKAAKAEGKSSDIGFYKFMALAKTYGSDVVFGAMTRSLRDASPKTRAKIEASIEKAQNVIGQVVPESIARDLAAPELARTTAKPEEIMKPVATAEPVVGQPEPIPEPTVSKPEPPTEQALAETEAAKIEKRIQGRPEIQVSQGASPKRAIQEITGMRKITDEVITNTMKQLKDQMRIEVKAGKRGAIAGRKQIREQVRIKNETNKTIDQIRKFEKLIGCEVKGITTRIQRYKLRILWLGSILVVSRDQHVRQRLIKLLRARAHLSADLETPVRLSRYQMTRF